MLNKTVTASFDVDAQKCFTYRCPEELPVKGGEDIAPALNKQATFAKYRVGSKDCHSPASLWVDTDKNPQFTPIPGYENLDIRWKVHGVPGTPGFNLIDGLPKIPDYDYFVWKGMELDMHPYGACYHDLADTKSTGVIEWMRAQGIKNVIVGGIASDFCVRKTVLQLRAAKFEVVVNMESCRGIWATTTEEEQIDEFRKAGCIVIRSTAELELLVET